MAEDMGKDPNNETNEPDQLADVIPIFKEQDIEDSKKRHPSNLYRRLFEKIIRPPEDITDE